VDCWRVGACLRQGGGRVGCQAATLRVQPGQDLQAAVDAAAPGDVVEVEQRGHVRATCVIDKPLTLRGLSRPTSAAGTRATPSASRPPTW
jgi:nitrous oxidase accessory protein NosD